jgi:hypothetical protein
MTGETYIFSKRVAREGGEGGERSHMPKTLQAMAV